VNKHKLYRPQRTDILLTPYRTNLEYQPEDIPDGDWPDMEKTTKNAQLDHPIFDELFEAAKILDMPWLRVTTIKGAFPRGYSKIEELRQFPVFLFLPYQASVMSFFELYRLNVPILVPSAKLLLTWIIKYKILFERVYGDPIAFKSFLNLPSPNSFDPVDAERWIQYYDIYQEKTFPHLLYFNDWEHALKILSSTDLTNVAAKMQTHNIKEFHRITSLWKEVLPQENHKFAMDLNKKRLTFDEALWAHYEVKADDDLETICASTADDLPDKLANFNLARESKCMDAGKAKNKQVDAKSSLHAVTTGDYIKHCDQIPQYDEVSDILSCEIRGKKAYLSSPFACARISITFDGQLICF
jgi:hypothetical protein